MNKHRLAGVLTAALALPLISGTAAAADTYRADSDTGIEALDYIENEHRAERENRLTPEQEKLLADAKALEKSLKHPFNPKKEAVPAVFEGEELIYDERDGSFTAKGKVDILQMDARRYQGELVTGNTKRQEVDIPDKAHILQVPKDEMRVTLDGYRAHYNYGKKTGSIEDATGKVGAHYITGKRFEFYPDKIVVYNGTETKCGAKKPDYHMSAKKLTYYPQKKIVLENVSFHVRGKKLFSRKYYEVDVSPDKKKHVFPRIGYNNDDGVYIKWDLVFPVRPNLNVNTNLYVNTKDGWRSNYDLTWQNRGMKTGVTYGHFEDGDSKWIHKEPSGFWNYNDRIGKTHFTYGLGTEYGHWYGDGVHSNHWEYGASLGYDPIKFHRYTLYLKTGYSVTRESYDDSRVNGWSYDAVMTKDFNDRWAAYTGYHYTKKTQNNTLFNYNNDDYSKKLEGGFSYRIDDINRVAVGTKYDLDHSKWKNIDYYWYHDLHCSQVIVRYRSKTNQISLRWQFTPW